MILIYNFSRNLIAEKIVKTSFINSYGKILIKSVKNDSIPKNLEKIFLVVFIGTKKSISKKLIQKLKKKKN